jgi:hypothetical protein
VRSGPGKNNEEQTKKKKSTVVSSKKKWTMMNPIWCQMKNAAHPVLTGALVAAGSLWPNAGRLTITSLLQLEQECYCLSDY